MRDIDSALNTLMKSLNPATDEEIKDYEEKLKLEESRKKKDKLESHYLLSSGVPERYHKESFETFQAYNEALRDILITVRNYAENPGNRILILSGGNGCGKTHLACGIIRETGGYYLSAQRLLMEAESAMSFKAKESKIEYLDRLAGASMLVLDEVARGYGTERQAELVQYLLDERYARNKPLVLVTNLNKADFVTWIGKSATDRLNEVCKILILETESYRNIKRSMDL